MLSTFHKKMIFSGCLIACVILTGWFVIHEIAYSDFSKPVPSIYVAAPVEISSLINLGVPFTSQAPTADWRNPFFADGCEETSAIMAMHWVHGTGFTPSEAAKEITSLTDFEIKKFGGFYPNISAQDTATLMKEYYGYDNIKFVPNITINDIKAELSNGNVVLVPTNSQKLHNPHYTGAGSETHMIVIVGYDPETKEFIANDPGTRYGEEYRYKEAYLGNALRDYPTGPYQKSYGTDKDMIVVSRNSL